MLFLLIKVNLINEIKYANRKQNLQKELGLEVSDFKCLEGLDEEDMKFYKTYKYSL